MKNTIILDKSLENELNQILNELIYSLKKTYSDDDLIQMSLTIFKESTIETLNSKKDIATSTLKTIDKYFGIVLKSTKNKFQKYKDNGFQNELCKDYCTVKSQVFVAPDKIISLSKSIKDKISEANTNFFRKSKEEKIEIIAVTLMGVLIFYASAGGEDFEGGIPDSDLKFGIGTHRNIFSHSILIGFMVEFLMRSGTKIMDKSYKNLPDEHHVFWDKTNHYINKHKGVAIGAMWAGIGAHLLKDASIFSTSTKPYTGVPFEMSMGGHQSLFMANATAAEIFAFNEINRSKTVIYL